MNTPHLLQRQMLKQVAEALGADLRPKMTFVGGCTTALLLTDPFTQEQVRSTDDVDLIVHVMSHMEYHQLQKQLAQRGFRLSPDHTEEEMPICAMTLGSLRVDFMPDSNVLGFTNRWYAKAMETATDYSLDANLTIKLVSPVYFVATKLEAWKGRGKCDALSSRDIEDLLNMVDGRPELLEEIATAPQEIQGYIAEELRHLLDDPNFQYAVNSQSRGSSDRENILYDRLEALTKGAV